MKLALIETFFKALKQYLKIKTFVGTSAIAVKTQIWTAVNQDLCSIQTSGCNTCGSPATAIFNKSDPYCGYHGRGIRLYRLAV
jgi:hypothetical protein